MKNYEPPLSKNSDPITSCMAADELIESGRHDHQCKMVFGHLLAYITENMTGPTSAELAKFSGLDRYTVARRLPDLEYRRLVYHADKRICSVSGRLCVTWGVMV